ncbi:YraN family protein [Candidatus Gracilibacteria bacterium]|nr:YraN family protein [Candidatus Gracilibacteria bacterium]
MHNQKVGKIGEQYAERFLNAQGYQVITTNFRSAYGEIDIISMHKNTLIFVEVKTRTNDDFGTPQESISYLKLQKIFKTALHFLNTANKTKLANWRIDAIAVKLNKSLALHDIEHFKNIFDGSGKKTLNCTYSHFWLSDFALSDFLFLGSTNQSWHRQYLRRCPFFCANFGRWPIRMP